MAKADCDTWSDEDAVPSGKRRAEGLEVEQAPNTVVFKRPRPCLELRIANQSSTLSSPSAEDSDADSSEAPRSKPTTLAVDCGGNGPDESPAVDGTMAMILGPVLEEERLMLLECFESDLNFLPHELILHVMTFVPPKELIRSRPVCRRWCAMTHDPHLWKAICIKTLSPMELAKPPHRSWQWLYLAHRMQFSSLQQATRVGCFMYESGARYMGDFSGGQRDGWGLLIEKNLNRYEGEWKADKECGKGTKIWKGGSRYDGEWMNGKKHGRARICWGDGEWKGDVYEGDWLNDHREGSGRYLWSNGDRYEGRWTESKINGRGVKIWANGDAYEGDWKDDERHGNGVYRWPSGNQYYGQWHVGKTSGYGIKFWNNGDSYEGEWLGDNRHGFGVYTWSSGSVYQGAWRDGKKEGRGMCVWADGAAYDGQWARNFRHMKGKYIFPDGSRYEGMWCNNLRHGYGVMVWKDGQVYKGEWFNDNRVDDDDVEKTWDRYFLKPWEDQRVYIRRVLGVATASPSPAPASAPASVPSIATPSSHQQTAAL